jgi:hypothetical protein
MPAHRATRWKRARLLLAGALLTACASSSQHSNRGELRLDTETAGKIRHAAAASKGTSSLASAATGAVASRLAKAVPILLTVLEDDNAVGELEERLVECAMLAERQVNASHFGNRAPTRKECGEEVVVDGCPEPITRAMLWPAPFSIEQRYRYYPNAKVLETVSRQEEARLMAQGCTRELWRTIKPDIVLGENSAYAGFDQGQIYKDALGGDALIISPQGVVPP